MQRGAIFCSYIPYKVRYFAKKIFKSIHQGNIFSKYRSVFHTSNISYGRQDKFGKHRQRIKKYRHHANNNFPQNTIRTTTKNLIWSHINPLFIKSWYSKQNKNDKIILSLADLGSKLCNRLCWINLPSPHSFIPPAEGKKNPTKQFEADWLYWPSPC